MKTLKSIAIFIESIQSLIELIKLVMLTIIIVKVLSFGNTIISNMQIINNNISHLAENVVGASAKIKEIGGDIASIEFTEKTDAITDNVVDAKNRFLSKFKE